LPVPERTCRLFAPWFSQGKLCWVLQTLAMCCGLHFSTKRLANAPTLQEQRKQWDGLALVYFCKHGPQLLVWLFSKLLALLLFNRFVLWFGGGVPGKQYALIQQDGIPIEKYLARTVDGELLLCYFSIVILLCKRVHGKQYALIQQDGIPIEKYLARTVDGELLFLLLFKCCVTRLLCDIGYRALLPGMQVPCAHSTDGAPDRTHTRCLNVPAECSFRWTVEAACLCAIWCVVC
jgi:predicted regulator of Ras-like GTPase activity (Roadblock/LC7/MglB family)